MLEEFREANGKNIREQPPLLRKEKGRWEGTLFRTSRIVKGKVNAED